jgi:AcrR family transcriptional regulator
MAQRPYRLGKRGVTAEATRARILAGARRLLSTKATPPRFSIEAVARAAKVTRLTVYNQFGSKAALLEALFDDLGVRGGMSGIAATLRMPDPDEALRAYLSVLCGFFAAHRTVLRRLTAFAVLDADLEAAIAARVAFRRNSTRLLAGRMLEKRGRGTSLLEESSALLFMLTSFQTFDTLSGTGYAESNVSRLILRLAVRAFDAEATLPS